MNTTWQQTSPDQIEIRADRKPLLLLLGIPFLAIGLWMFWNFFGALADVLTGRVKLMDDIFGLILLPVFGVLFGWPGVLLVLVRKRWIADGISRQVQIITSLGPKSWTKHCVVADFKAVRAYRGVASSREFDDTESDVAQKERVQPFCVELTAEAKGQSPQIMGAFGKAPASREFGSALAKVLRLPYVDEIVEGNRIVVEL